MDHKLHKEIGKEISELKLDNLKIILDSVCNKNISGDIEVHDISLFTDKKSNITKLCNVDALIMQENEVKVIIEIDESNTSPNQICGKYMTSAFSNRYHYNDVNILIPEKTVLFIQVIDTKKFPKKSKKEEKLKIIEKIIEENTQGIIKEYALLTDKNKEQIIKLMQA